ncbi:MAG TPA: response regulator [Planctomycetaceae bacterium]|nr:response regulator [Planctomycetaceae bacterium]
MKPLQTRIAELAHQAETKICRQTDRMFAGLLLFQWVAGLAVARWISPLTWAGGQSSVHAHVWAASLLGGGILTLPLWLAFNRGGAVITRHVIAIAQMLSSALLIHLSGGRLETHFHVFGSLAFLSFYRDWRVILTGTVVVAADHFLRGLYWPESAYGLVTGAEWRWLEHAGWVVFIDIFLVYSCVRSRKEMWAMAERQAKLEETNATIEQTVGERTSDLQERTNELQEACEQKNAIVQTALDAVVSMSANGNITAWNSQAEQMFGYSAAEVLGRSMSETIIPQRFRPQHQAGFLRYQETGTSSVLNRRIEMTALRRDGNEFPVELSVAAIRNGADVSFCAFVRDITDRLQAAENLCRAKEAAEMANSAKSEFLANMSHEIRTPMNGILGMTELLLDTELTAEQGESLDLVKSSAESLMRVINDILDYSKIEAGKLDLDPVEFQLRDALEDTLKTLALRAHRKGLELTCDIAADVPVRVIGDPGRLRQIVVNLVGNAIKFTETGEVVVRARLRNQSADGFQLHFEVADTGIGVPLEKQKLIFDPFSQADGSTTRRFGGTGLGLTISSRLVALMGGQIGLESQPGCGSTFHFDAHFGRAKTPAAEPGSASSAKLKGLRVLVVDDNATNRRVLSGILRMWQARPTAVDSGPAAVQELRRAAASGEPYPLLLTDAMMPEMDGFMLVEELRKEPNLAPRTIMMLTSADRQTDAARCRRLGMSAYLVKPVKADELQITILAALSGITREKRAPALAPQNSAGAAAAAQACSRFRILLAEDNPVNQRVAMHILQKGEHSVVAVGNGREAVDALAREDFDVVLMDVQMPEMDGFEATDAIRTREQITGRHVPIVAMTAHAMQGDRERCLEAGMDDYLSKPVRAAQLLELIQKFAPKPATAPVFQARAAMAGERPVFDRETALERINGEEQLLDEVIQLFLSDAPSRLAEVRASLEQGDPKRLQIAAHSLKGAAGYVGAERTSAQALKLEELGQKGDLSPALDEYRQLEHEIEQLRQAIADFNAEPHLNETSTL